MEVHFDMFGFFILYDVACSMQCNLSILAEFGRKHHLDKDPS